MYGPTVQEGGEWDRMGKGRKGKGVEGGEGSEGRGEDHAASISKPL